MATGEKRTDTIRVLHVDDHVDFAEMATTFLGLRISATTDSGFTNGPIVVDSIPSFSLYNFAVASELVITRSTSRHQRFPEKLPFAK
jgi:hypothetical protein